MKCIKDCVISLGKQYREEQNKNEKIYTKTDKQLAFSGKNQNSVSIIIETNCFFWNRVELFDEICCERMNLERTLVSTY